MQVAKRLGGVQSLEGGHTGGSGAGNTFCASFGEEVGNFILVQLALLPLGTLSSTRSMFQHFHRKQQVLVPRVVDA